MELSIPLQVYLPIAEVSVNIFVLLGLGGMVGVLSGMFGVGGGFILTPLLFFVGIPPTVAVATGANQIVASSFSGVLAHFKRRTVDLKMGMFLLVGGLAGAAIGVQVFAWLTALGQIELIVTLTYVLFLGLIGGLMFIESVNALRKSKHKAAKRGKHHSWIQHMPFKTRFRVSRLYISVIPPITVGFLVGFLSAIMGVGGGFIMVPAMIYLLGMPTKVVVGTSLFQIIFVAAYATIMHAYESQTVDAVLALTLIISGVVGAQFGSVIGLKLKAEHLRVLLSLMVLAICIKLGISLIVEPSEVYSIIAR